MDDAAKLLLSVSPRIMPSRPRSLSHLEPLESLAGLAMLGEPQKKEVEKLRSCLDGISSAAPMGSLSLFNNNFMINYPYYPIMTNKMFDLTNPAISQSETVVMPWATSIKLTDTTPFPDPTKIISSKCLISFR